MTYLLTAAVKYILLTVLVVMIASRSGYGLYDRLVSL